MAAMLTGSFYLCPAATSGNPENENDWLKFEYIGVPPGKTLVVLLLIRLMGIYGYYMTRDGLKKGLADRLEMSISR